MEAGIVFEIHPQWEPPDLENKGLAVGPGNHAYVGMLRREVLDLEEPNLHNTHTLELRIRVLCLLKFTNNIIFSYIFKGYTYK